MAIDIPSRELSTPLTGGGLDVCKGFALYPSIGAAGLGRSNTSAWVLVNEAPQILAWTVHIRAKAGFYVGICGPAYAARLEVEGSVSDDLETLTLELTDSDTEAGMILGFGITFDLYLQLDQLHLETHWVSDGWDSHLEIETRWREIGQTSFSLTFDLGHILLNWFLEDKTAPVAWPSYSGLLPPETTGVELSSFSSLDRKQRELRRTGEVELEPSWSVSCDLLQLAGTAVVGPEFAEADEFLRKYGVVLRFGPRLTLGMPVDVRVTHVRAEGGEYEIAPDDTEQSLEGNAVLQGSRTGDSPVSGGDLELTLTHGSGVHFTIDLYVQVQFLKKALLNHISPPFGLLDLLDHTVTTGDHENTLGDSPAAALAAAGLAQRCGCEYEVVFEAPAVVAEVGG